METASRADLATFKVSAWASNVDAIPPARTLAIPEPMEQGDETPSPAQEFSDDSRDTPPVRQRESLKFLKYKVLVHVDCVEEDQDREERWYAPAPASSDSGQSDIPDGGRDFDDGARESRRPPWQLGVPDRRGGGRHVGGNGQGGQTRSYCQIAAGFGDWQLPPMGGR